MERWERRERRRQSNRRRMPVQGKSVLLLHRIIQRRAAQARRSNGQKGRPADDSS